MKVTITEKIPTGVASYSCDLEDFGKNMIGFGRQQGNDILFISRCISRMHGRIYMDRGAWFIEDLNSTSGLYLGGRKLTSPVQLQSGMEFVMIDQNRNVCASLRFESSASGPANGSEGQTVLRHVEEADTVVGLTPDDRMPRMPGNGPTPVNRNGGAGSNGGMQPGGVNGNGGMQPGGNMSGGGMQRDGARDGGSGFTGGYVDENGRCADGYIGERDGGSKTFVNRGEAQTDVPKKKKGLMIGLICGGAAVLLAVVILIVVLSSKGGGQKEISAAINDYAADINNMDVEAVLNETIPYSLLEKAAMEGEEMTGDELAEFREECEDDWKEIIKETQSACDTYGIQITLKVNSIGEANELSVKEMLQDSYDSACDIFGYGESEMKENAVDDAYTALEEALGSDIMQSITMYKVSVDTDIDWSWDKSFEDEIGYDLRDDGIDLDSYRIKTMYVYEYNSEYYVLPDILIGMEWPAYFKYDEKAKKSNDVSNAQTIATAFTCALSVEAAWDSYGKFWNEYIEFTKAGMDDLAERGGSAFRDEMMSMMDDKYPEVEYDNEDGSKTFAIRFSAESESVEVYVHDGDNYIMLSPDVDSSYK